MEDARGGPDILEADSMLIRHPLGILARVQHVGHVPDPSATALEDGLPIRSVRVHDDLGGLAVAQL
jgi:hypothetical protein